MSTFKQTACGACGQKLRYLDSQAGEVARCPKCGHGVQFGKPRQGPTVGDAASGGKGAPRTPGWMHDVKQMADDLPEGSTHSDGMPIGLPKPPPTASGWANEPMVAPQPGHGWPEPAPRPRGYGPLAIGSSIVAVLALAGALTYAFMPPRNVSGAGESKQSAAAGQPGASAADKGTGSGGANGGNAPEPQKQPEAPPKNGEPNQNEPGKGGQKPAGTSDKETPKPADEGSAKDETAVSRGLDPNRLDKDEVEAVVDFEDTVFAPRRSWDLLNSTASTSTRQSAMRRTTICFRRLSTRMASLAPQCLRSTFYINTFTVSRVIFGSPALSSRFASPLRGCLTGCESASMWMCRKRIRN